MTGRNGPNVDEPNIDVIDCYPDEPGHRPLLPMNQRPATVEEHDTGTKSIRCGRPNLLRAFVERAFTSTCRSR